MSRNHPVRNLVEVGFSGGFTRGSSFLATPGFVTGVPLGHGSARKLWIMGRYRPPRQSQSGTCRGGGGSVGIRRVGAAGTGRGRTGR